MSLRTLTPFFGRTPRTPTPGDTDPFTSLRREMDRMFDDFSRGFPAAAAIASQGGLLSPKIDVAETESGLEIRADLPGVDPKDIHLEVTDGVMTLRADHSEEREEKDEKKRYHLVERSQGTYVRRIALPFEADEEKVDAKFEKGVLHVIVPRSQSAEKQPRRIEIKGK